MSAAFYSELDNLVRDMHVEELYTPEIRAQMSDGMGLMFAQEGDYVLCFRQPKSGRHYTSDGADRPYRKMVEEGQVYKVAHISTRHPDCYYRRRDDDVKATILEVYVDKSPYRRQYSAKNFAFLPPADRARREYDAPEPEPQWRIDDRAKQAALTAEAERKAELARQALRPFIPAQSARTIQLD